ncbi:MAG: hypothetical protein LM556_03020, partial [Desulfurococcaceae archaeon]|nr:hypothetical protein [Desulfurococcaceae archaeon]
RSFLENEGIIVLEDIQIGCEKCIEDVVEDLLKFAKPSHDEFERLRAIINKLIVEAEARGIHMSESELLRYIEEYLVGNINDVVNYLLHRKRIGSLSAEESSA